MRDKPNSSDLSLDRARSQFKQTTKLIKKTLSDQNLLAQEVKLLTRKFGRLPSDLKDLGQTDLDKTGSLHEHLAWALDEISGGDYSKTPRHDCEFKTNPEKGHCDFCWGFWAAVGECFPEKFETDINDD